MTFSTQAEYCQPKSYRLRVCPAQRNSSKKLHEIIDAERGLSEDRTPRSSV
jgi:hypothetical protein